MSYLNQVVNMSADMSVNSQNMQKVTRALISVSDKNNLSFLSEILAKYGIEIISTGGTAKELAKINNKVIDIKDYTKFPEILDGRVKTLNPLIYGGILSKKDNNEHIKQMLEHNINSIELVVVNLYPFVNAVLSNKSDEEIIENIDIGGPSMVRASAKNYKYTTIITDPNDYLLLAEELDKNKGNITTQFRKKMATKAFQMIAQYDIAISNWFASQNQEQENNVPNGADNQVNIKCSLKQALRYGENPHQEAKLYQISKITADANKIDGINDDGIVSAKQIQGKELSYNNIADADAAVKLVSEFVMPACAIIKHANPCGVAIGINSKTAYEKALACDIVSSYGGIVAFNREVDEDTAHLIKDNFFEVIIVPSITEKAKEILAPKSKMRILILDKQAFIPKKELEIKSVGGGILIQDRDILKVSKDDLTVVTHRKPSDEEIENMLFAFSVCKHVRSNAIVIAKDKQAIGIGAGQMSRVDSVSIAISRAEKLIGSGNRDNLAIASDAFFPFADGLLLAADYGIKSVIQPGGSIRDSEVIEAANKHNIAMVFTGKRHFKH